MMGSILRHARVIVLGAVLAFQGAGWSAWAGDPKPHPVFLTRLVWGTDREKPPGKHLKRLPKALQKKLSGVFKWRHYFQVSQKKFSFPRDDGKRIRVSKKCELLVKRGDGETLNVKLYGERRLTRTLVQKMEPILRRGEVFVVGGDDKDSYGDAWFILITAADRKK